jgi:hypothetical protein
MTTISAIYGPTLQIWNRIEELDLHTAQQTAWLQVAHVQEEDLAADDLVVTDIRIGELESHDDANAGPTSSWEERPAGIWMRRRTYMAFNRRRLRPRTPLTVRGNGTFRFVQISDTYMATSVGVRRRH